MSNTQEYRSEIRNFYKQRDKDAGGTGLLNMVKGANLLNRSLKSGSKARYGFDYASQFASMTPDEYSEFAPSWMQKLYKHDELVGHIANFSSSGSAHGSSWDMFKGDVSQGINPTASTEAMESVGSMAPGGESAGAKAGLMNNPYALGAMAIAGIGYGIGKKGTTLNRWFKK